MIKPRRVNLETGEIDYGQGWVPYDYSERVAIAMESGASEHEARQVAFEDSRRRLNLFDGKYPEPVLPKK